MTDTQTTALNRALLLLKAAGCEYAVRTAAGELLGTLPIAPPPKARRHARVNRFADETGYVAMLRAMAPGDVKSIELADPSRLEAFRSCVSAQASKFWGRGNSITSLTATAVEVLRVG